MTAELMCGVPLKPTVTDVEVNKEGEGEGGQEAEQFVFVRLLSGVQKFLSPQNNSTSLPTTSSFSSSFSSSSSSSSRYTCIYHKTVS
jgi:hypothetical protein